MPQKPPQAAIDFLKANPDKWREFRQKYETLPDGFAPPAAPTGALELLGQNPKLSEQFDQKYGYLPRAEPPAAPPQDVPSPSLGERVGQAAGALVDLNPTVKALRPLVQGADIPKLEARSAARTVEGSAALTDMAANKIGDAVDEGPETVRNAGALFKAANPVLAGVGQAISSAAPVVRDIAKKAEDQAVQALSPEWQKAIQEQLIERDADGKLAFGAGATDPKYYAAQAIDMGVMMVPGMGASGAAARLTYASRYAEALAQASARKVPQSVALRYAEKAANKAAVRAATIAGGISEGGIAGGMNASQVQETLEQVDEKTLLAYPAYRELREKGLSHEVARARVARDQGFAAGLASAAVTGLTGAPLNAMIGKLVTGGGGKLLHNVGEGIALEGGQEFLQEGSDAIITNKAEQPITGKGTWDGVLESAITGGVLGAIMGGGTGLAGSAFEKPNTKPTQELAAKHRAYQDAREALQAAEEAAKDPNVRIDKATVDAARETSRTAMVDLGQAMLSSGKLDAKQQREIAGALEQARAEGVEAEAAPVQGEVRDPATANAQASEPSPAPTPAVSAEPSTGESAASGAAPESAAPALNEVETKRAESLERLANADTIEAADLNALVSAGLARTNATGRPLLTPAGRRQRTELSARVAAAEAKVEAAKTQTTEPAEAEAPAPKAVEPAVEKAPTKTVADLGESDFQALERLGDAKPVSDKEAGNLVAAGLVRKAADGSFVLKPAGRREARVYKQSGRQLPIEKEFVPAIEGDTLKVPASGRARVSKKAQVDAAYAAREKAAAKKKDQDFTAAQNEAGQDTIAKADAQGGVADTSIEDALTEAKGKTAASRDRAEKRQADQMTELGDLEAVQRGEATFGQIGLLAQRGLAKKNTDGSGALLPAGKRRIAELKRLPQRDEKTEARRAQKAGKTVEVNEVKGGFTVGVKGAEPIATVKTREEADALVKDLPVVRGKGTTKPKKKPKGVVSGPEGPIVAEQTPEQAKELIAGQKDAKFAARMVEPEAADERLRGARKAAADARKRIEDFGLHPDADGLAIENDTDRWVFMDGDWINETNTPPPSGVAALANQLRAAHQAAIDTMRPILESVQTRVIAELGVNLQIANTVADVPSRYRSVHAAGDGRISGFMSEDADGNPQIWIIGTGLMNYEMAYSTALHEAVGHYGLRGLLGPDYAKTMQAIRKAFPAAVAGTARRNHLDPLLDGDLAAEELVAYSTEHALGQDVNARSRTLWSRVVNFVRKALRQLGWASKMKESELDDLILRARDFVRRKPNQAYVTQNIYRTKVAAARTQVQVEVVDNQATAEVGGGKMTATLMAERGLMWVTSAEVSRDARGSGLGVQMAEALFAEAAARGLTLSSDSRVSENAARVYGALERRGYTVKRNPTNLDRGTGELTSKSELKGVFEVTSPPAAFAKPAPKPLNGLPTKITVPGQGVVSAGPFMPARQAAEKYRRDNKITAAAPTAYARVDLDFAKRVAQAFEDMKHAPTDPQVKAAYAAMIQETIAQYQYVKATGLKVEFISGVDPYKASPRLAIEDVKQNNHLWVFPTDVGFGSAGAGADYVTNNPLLQPTTEKIGDRILLANDVFRIVHDYFGHIAEGNGFRADGEETAWRLHASMYSPLARAAMTTETRGQNSWLNFGPHGEKNRTATTDETQFADQKIGLLPVEFQATPEETPEPSVTGQIADILTKNGGFTMNPFSGIAPTQGWAFSPSKSTERVFDFMPTAMDLQQYIVEHAAELRKPGMFLGGWRDETSGKVYIDISKVFDDKARAAAEKQARAAGQLAMFNLGTFESARFDAPKSSKAKLAAQQTLTKVSKYLTPEERGMVNQATAKKLVDLFKELPSDKDLAAAAIAGQAKRGWYRKSAEALVNVFGPDSSRFAALLAALSPQTSVEMNLTNAVRVWSGWVKAGRPTDRPAILRIMGAHVQGSLGEGSVLDAWKNNSVRALTSEDPEGIQLSGPKVDSFAANLRGEANAVTLDTWMANFALVEQKIFGGIMSKAGRSGKRFGYLAYSARVRQAAQYLTKMTGEEWSPAEVQETVWSWAKAATEEADSFGALGSVADLVNDNEITDALINATPDFATLLQNDEYERVLREAGYGDALDRSASETAAQPSAPIKKIAALEGDQKRLLKAAERLDKLRAQRRQADDGNVVEPAFSILGGNTGDPHLDSFLSKFGGPKRTLKQMWSDWTDSITDRIALGVFDQFHGIKRAEALAGISTADSGYISARLSSNSAELVRAMLEFGYPVWNGGAPDVAGGIGLMEILKPIGKDINLWLAYMVAKRADRLMGQGRENLFAQTEINAALKLGQRHPEFLVVAQKYADFQAKVLDFAQTAGVIDPASRALWEHADYIPFYRMIDNNQISQSGNAGTLANVRNQIRQLRGGDTNLGDPLENIIRNWLAMTDASLKATATRETVDNLNGTGLVTRAPQFEMTAAIIPLAQIKTWIKSNPILVQAMNAVGLDPAKLSPQAFVGLQKMMAVQAPSDEDVISVWRNGKREYWKVHDGLLLQSLQGIDKKAWGPIMEIFRFPKRLLTAMVTTTPQFAVKNLWRDMWHAFVQGAGRETIVPGLDTVKGTISQLKMDTDSQSMLAGGGSFTHGYIRAGDLEGGAATIRSSLRGTTAGGYVLGTPARLWHFYRDLLNASENAHRVQIYRRLQNQGATRKEALYEARDMLDFTMRGKNAAVQFLVESVPFMNARLQGLYRLGRGFKADFASIAIRGLLLTAATAAIFAMNQDDDRYRELTPDQKNTYWHFWDVFQKGDHWKLPKPFEAGTLFGTVPEAILDATLAADREPDAAKQSLQLVGHAFTQVLNLSPKVQTVWPILELAINENTFTGAPILNLKDQGLPAVDQDSPRVSPTYRAIAQAMPNFAPDALRSPKQLEHLGRGYLGNLQDYVLIVADALARKANGEADPPARAADDWPGLRDFRSTGASRHTKYLDALYSIADEAEKISRAHKNAVDAEDDQGDARAEQLETESGPLLDVQKDFSKATDQVGKLRKQQREIQLDTDMTPEDKRTEIDELQQEINDIAKETYDLRPGGKLNPDTAANLLDADEAAQVKILRDSGLPATSRLLAEAGELA